MKNVGLTFIFFIVSIFQSTGQRNPYEWTFTSIPVTKDEVELNFLVAMDNSWCINPQKSYGPMPTTHFTFLPSDDYELIDEVKELSTLNVKHSKDFRATVLCYSGKALFIQRAKLKKPSAVIEGKIAFLVWHQEACPPENLVEFKIKASLEAKQNLTSSDQ